jgi:hypothetical protein
LPYGIQKAEIASMLATKNWLKELAKEILKAKWEINYIHNDHCQKASRYQRVSELQKR